MIIDTEYQWLIVRDPDGTDVSFRAAQVCRRPFASELGVHLPTKIVISVEKPADTIDLAQLALMIQSYLTRSIPDPVAPSTPTPTKETA